MANKFKPGAKSKHGPPPSKRRGKLFLLIILAPIAIALGGGTLLYLWSKNKAAVPETLPQLKLDGADAAIVTVVNQARAEVEKSPRSGPAWGRLGITLAVHDFITEADRCFALAEKYEPGEVRWPYWRGLALSGTNLEAALPCLERASKLGATVPAAPLRYAEALIDRGRLDDAEKEINRVYAQDTNDARALLDLARIALGRDQLSDSLDYLARSIALASNVAPSYRLLATVQERLGNADASAKARRIAARLPEVPEWPDPLMREANTYRTGKESAASFADLLLQQGRADEAIALMQQTTQAYPTFARGWILLGRGLLEKKDYAGAEKALRTAEKLAPDAAEVQPELGSALFEQERYAEAETCYRAALRAVPNQAELWFNVGLCLMNQKNNEAAIEAFRTAARSKPDFTYAYIRWGQALGRLNRAPEAMEQLRRALQLSPNNAEARAMLDVLERTTEKK